LAIYATQVGFVRTTASGVQPHYFGWGVIQVADTRVPLIAIARPYPVNDAVLRLCGQRTNWEKIAEFIRSRYNPGSRFVVAPQAVSSQAGRKRSLL
jgi:hypothetical protein